MAVPSMTSDISDVINDNVDVINDSLQHTYDVYFIHKMLRNIKQLIITVNNLSLHDTHLQLYH